MIKVKIKKLAAINRGATGGKTGKTQPYLDFAK
jgi:hypothetical protein